jgi:hypothetical protein
MVTYSFVLVSKMSGTYELESNVKSTAYVFSRYEDILGMLFRYENIKAVLSVLLKEELTN